MTTIEKCDITNTKWITKADYIVNVNAKEFADAYPTGLWVGTWKSLDYDVKLWWNFFGNCVMYELPEGIKIEINKEEFDLKKNITSLYEGGYIIGDNS